MKIRELFDDRVLTVSNLLSVSRGLTAPCAAFLFHLENTHPGAIAYRYAQIALLIFIILTDFFDGFLARLLRQETALGRFLDPIADKVTVLFVGTALCVYRNFPVWFLAFMIARDIITIVLATFLFSKKDIEVKPNLLGKSCVALIALSGMMFVVKYDRIIYGIHLRTGLLVATTVLCTISSIWYAAVWVLKYEKSLSNLKG